MNKRLFLDFFETIWVLVVSVIHRNPTKKKLVNHCDPPRKCAYQVFIIQNLDILTLELGMKVQFANFWQTEHIKKSAVRQ
jgi:hypothetical protein